MDAAAELGRNPVSKHQIQPEYGDEQADAGRVCRTRLARPNSRRERGQGNIRFPSTGHHEQDWQPYPVDPYSCYMCDHTCIQYSAMYPYTLRVYSIVCCCCCPNERRAAAERSEPFSETLRVHSTERTGWEEGERVDRLRPERHPGVWHNGGLESDGVKG